MLEGGIWNKHQTNVDENDTDREKERERERAGTEVFLCIPLLRTAALTKRVKWSCLQSAESTQMELRRLQRAITETEIKARGGQTCKDLKCNCMPDLLACWEKLRTNLLFKQPSNYLSSRVTTRKHENSSRQVMLGSQNSCTATEAHVGEMTQPNVIQSLGKCVPNNAQDFQDISIWWNAAARLWLFYLSHGFQGAGTSWYRLYDETGRVEMSFIREKTLIGEIKCKKKKDC